MQIIIPNLCFIIPLDKLRKTPNVDFESIPMIDNLSSLDLVEHQIDAYSPSIKWNNNLRPWYMHPYQIDNLLVFKWTRLIELYTKQHTQIEKFEVKPNIIKHNGKIIYKWKAIFGRYTKVFHRVYSPKGSTSINLAQHIDWFDIKTNFNIYDLNTQTNNVSLLRKWQLDQ